MEIPPTRTRLKQLTNCLVYGTFRTSTSIGGLMEDELKWLTPRKMWRYIPNRYQALVAQIVAAFLVFNLFQLLFEPVYGNQICGTLLRPVLDDQLTPGWFWNAGPFRVNRSIGCPRQTYLLWREFFASFIGLAVCGLVLRRAIKRMSATHPEQK